MAARGLSLGIGGLLSGRPPEAAGRGEGDLVAEQVVFSRLDVLPLFVGGLGGFHLPLRGIAKTPLKVGGSAPHINIYNE